MTVLRVLLLAALMTVMCSAAWSAEPELISKSEYERVYMVKVNPDMEPLEFRTMYYANPGFMSLSSIEVYRGGQPLQTVHVGMKELLYEVEDPFHMIDINEDGYKDIGTVEWRDPIGSERINYWLYHPEADRFEYHEALNAMYNASLGEDGTITSWGNEEGEAWRYSVGVYRWEGYDLVLIFSVEQDYDKAAGKYHKVTSKLRDGRMVVVGDRMLSADEARYECDNSLQMKY